MKTAVIYARYSSDNQTEQSIEGQLRVCRQYAENNDIIIVHTYIDRAMTGTNDNRPDFQQMIKDSSKKEWDYVLVYKLDRFSRNKYESVIHKKTLKDNNIKVLSAMENIPDSPEGTLMEAMLEGFNQYYSEELRQKVKRGMRETRLKGYYQGGAIPYGYKLDGRKLIIDEDKKEIIFQIYNQYANSVFVRQIIENFTSQGIFNKGKPFATNTIYNILNNEIYTGIYEKNGETFTNMYPRIIDDELFNKVKAKHKTNRYGKQSIKAVYLFKSKLVCGYCGKPVSAESGTTRHGKKINYYKCSGIKKYRNGCEKETVRKDILEEFLLDSIISELNKPKHIEIIVKKLMEAQNSQDNTSATLTILNKQKKQAETTLNNLLKAVENGVSNKTTNNRMTELEKQIDELTNLILIEKGKTSIKRTEDEIRKFYADALKQKPIILINYLIKEIKLYNDRYEITFNRIISMNPDDKGSFLFSKIKKLKKIIQNKPETMFIDIKNDYYI